MTTPLPPIYRDCRRLLVHTEQAVRRFSRYHKYTVGTDLRQQAMALMRAVHQAVFDRAHLAQHVQSLVWRADDYKLTLQLAMEVGAFKESTQGSTAATHPSFQAFEVAATLAAGIGKQCGGWLQQVAKRSRAQAGTGGEQPPAAGLKPVPTAPAHPASLSACATPHAGGTP